METIYSTLLSAKAKKQKQLAVLLDPDKIDWEHTEHLIAKIKQSPATHIFVGGSLLVTNVLDQLVALLKEQLDLPILLFPGNVSQITPRADGILFLSLLSGRNPDYLIGQQVLAAPILQQTSLEIISTAYILIESGKQTTVSYVSNTVPIPADKPEIVLATALAGTMIGHKLVYLEAGSGAERKVDPETIRLVASNIQVPLIVGGGIRSRSAMEEAYEAGADLVVIGTAFEKDNNFFDYKNA